MLIPQNIKAATVFRGLASLAAGLLILVATTLIWIFATVLVAAPLAPLFPHAGSVATAILFAILALPMGFGVVWLMCHCWPWYDTIIVILWVAFQAHGFQGQPWPSFVIGATALLVVSAVLRWVQYVRERRPRARTADAG